MARGHSVLSSPREEGCAFGNRREAKFRFEQDFDVFLYTLLIGGILPRERCKGKDHAIVIAEMALAMQDFDIIIQDLRLLNDHLKNTSFDVYWTEIQPLLESHARVDDRRRGEINVHMLLMI